MRKLIQPMSAQYGDDIRRDVITHPYINGSTSMAVWLNRQWSSAWMINYIPLFYVVVTTYSCHELDAHRSTTLGRRPAQCWLNVSDIW